MDKRIERYIRFHWLDGTVNEGPGWGCTPRERAADAMKHLGYGGGSIWALDYWKELPGPTSDFRIASHHWKRLTPPQRRA